MKPELRHHLHQGFSADKPVLVGNEPKVFHSTLDVYKWLLQKQGIDIQEINVRA